MKSLIQLSTLFFAILFLFSGCKDENFDMPPHGRPQYQGEANISIKDFKQKYNADLVNISSNDVISGVVTANDESGNLYKQIFIEDETGGLMIAIDRNNIYNDYRIGQKLFIETNGLYMGQYGSFPQLGYQFIRNDGQLGIGQIAWLLAKNHIFMDDYPNPDLVEPITLSATTVTDDMFGRLVTLEGVFFDDAGKTYSLPGVDGGVQTLNRIVRYVIDEEKHVTTRMSSAANFAGDTIPAGVGNVTGILTKFGNTTQLLVRSREDIEFDFNPEGWGIKNSPWVVEYAINNQNKDLNGWVKGYIVGAVKGGHDDENPVSSNDHIDFTDPFEINNNIVIAASPDETNWENCVVVSLPRDSDIRKAVNLRDNPGNLQKEISIKGELAHLLGTAGLKVKTGNESEFHFGTAGKTFLELSLNQELSPFTEYSAKGDNQKWHIDFRGFASMSGFHDGSRFENEDWLISPGLDFSSSDAVFIQFEHITRYSDLLTDYKLLISTNYTSGDPNEAQWIEVPISKFSSGTSWDDWANTGRMAIPEAFMGESFVRIAFKYISTTNRAGTWQIKNLLIAEGDGIITEPGDPGDPGDPSDPGQPVGSGTQSNPYNVRAAVLNQGQNGQWVTGYIVGSVDGVSLNNSNFTAPFSTASNILIASSPNETDHRNCLPVQLPTGTIRDLLNLSGNPANKGKQVILYGNLATYFGTAGLRDVSNFILDGNIHNPTDPGDDPDPGTFLLSAPFTDTLTPFIGYSVVGAQEWHIDEHQGDKFAKMNGYDGQPIANEDWLISPVINFTEVENAYVVFEHAINYSTEMSEFTLWVSSDYVSGDPNSANWEQITIGNYPPGTNWTFVSSGNNQIPASYMGNSNVRIALKYTSTTERAGTWEVKNLFVREGVSDGNGNGNGNGNGDSLGSKDNPFDIQGIRANQGSGVKWAKGYIVGTVDGMSIQNNSNFSEPFELKTNILIAATPNETNYNNCIPIQLPNTAIRAQLNLNDNPENHGKEVLLLGSMEAYFGVDGVRSVSDFEFVE